MDATQVLVPAQDSPDDGWVFATSLDGSREGYVPASFLRVAGSPEEQAILAEAEGAVAEEIDG